jgi:hypothetical protein
MAMRPTITTLNSYEKFKSRQQKVLAQHEQFKMGLQKRQQESELKQADLDTGKRLIQMLDTRVPKGGRSFISNQMAGKLGLDPNAQGVKNFNTFVLGLDPQSSMQLRQQLSGAITNAPPGQVTEMTKAIMSGQADVSELLGQVDWQPQGGVTGGGASAGTQSNTAAKGDSMPQKTAQPFQQGAGAVQSFEGERTIPAASQQASPMLVGALGLDSRTRLRNNDLFTNGYRVPMEVKEQEKLAESIITRSTGLSSTISEAANLVDLFKGRPEVLGPVGSGTRLVHNTVRQVEGLFRVIRPGVTVEEPNDEVKALARRVGGTIASAHKLDTTAIDAHRIEAMVLGLAYRMAVANDIPGNRLTNGIIQQNLAQLGSSASPEAFEQVLRDTISNTTREFDEHLRRTVGVSGLKVLSSQLTNEDILRMAKSGNMLPVDFATALRDEAVRRQKGEQPGTGIITPQSPTLQEEEQTLGSMEMQDKTRKIQKTEQDMELDLSRDQRAQEAAQRAEGREDRMTAAQERQGQLQKEQFDWQKMEASTDNARADRAQNRADEREDRLVSQNETAQGLAREKFEYDKTQDAKKAEQDQHQAMAAAFINFGKMIAAIGGDSSSGSAGGGALGSLGAQQNQEAFRLTPTPQRNFPTPPRAQ